MANRLKYRGRRAAPATAPILSWDGETADTTPDLEIDIDETVGAGSVWTLERDTTNTFPSPTVFSGTISSGEDTANQIDVASSTVAAGTYYFRAKVQDSAWSNTVTVTVA
jgi:hypothetical protein